MNQLNLQLTKQLKIVNIFGNDIQIPENANVITINEDGFLQWFETEYPENLIPYEDCGLWGYSDGSDEDTLEEEIFFVGFSPTNSGIINYVQFDLKDQIWTNLKIKI